MAKYGNNKKRYQVGDYWLSQRKNASPAWFRTWFDTRTNQTRRASLGTENFAKAKQALDDWFVLEQTKTDQDPGQVAIAEVLARYWNEHGHKLRSKDQTRVALGYWLDFYEERHLADLRDVKLQEQFHQTLFDKGLKGSSVSRVITVGRAAINRAYKRGEVAHVPFIHDLPNAQKQSTTPRGRPLSIKEIGQLFAATPSDTMRSYIIWLLVTGARKEALLDLTLERCHIKDKLIELNPAGRVQTTKYRPTIRMPEVIIPMVKRLQKKYPATTHIIGLKQTRLGSPHESWNYARDKAKLDRQVNSYSMRHTISRELSRQQVSIYEINAHLGHKRQDMSITEVYAPYNPSYLTAAAKGIDSFFANLRADCVLIDEFLKFFPKS